MHVPEPRRLTPSPLIADLLADDLAEQDTALAAVATAEANVTAARAAIAAVRADEATDLDERSDRLHRANLSLELAQGDVITAKKHADKVIGLLGRTHAAALASDEAARRRRTLVDAYPAKVTAAQALAAEAAAALLELATDERLVVASLDAELKSNGARPLGIANHSTTEQAHRHILDAAESTAGLPRQLVGAIARAIAGESPYANLGHWRYRPEDLDPATLAALRPMLAAYQWKRWTEGPTPKPEPQTPRRRKTPAPASAGFPAD